MAYCRPGWITSARTRHRHTPHSCMAGAKACQCTYGFLKCWPICSPVRYKVGRLEPHPPLHGHSHYQHPWTTAYHSHAHSAASRESSHFVYTHPTQSLGFPHKPATAQNRCVVVMQVLHYFKYCRLSSPLKHVMLRDLYQNQKCAQLLVKQALTLHYFE